MAEPLCAPFVFVSERGAPFSVSGLPQRNRHGCNEYHCRNSRRDKVNQKATPILNGQKQTRRVRCFDPIIAFAVGMGGRFLQYSTLMDPTTRGILIGWAIVIILMALGMGMGLR
jgi:hypothetical protein